MNINIAPSTVRPIDYLDGIQFAPFNDDVLRNKLADESNAQNRLTERNSKISNKLGNLALSEANKRSDLYDVAAVMGQRTATDPLKPRMDNEISQLTETILSKFTLGKAVGIIAAKNSVHRVNAPQESDINADRPNNYELGFIGRKSKMAKANRLRKQEIRQDKATDAEVVFGGGIGLGSRASKRTALNHYKQVRTLRKILHSPMLTPQEYTTTLAQSSGKKRELIERYGNGPMTHADFLKAKNLVEKDAVMVPVKAVRREIRRERAGALVSLARARKPGRSLLHNMRKRVMKKNQSTIENRLIVSLSERQLIEDELLRRNA